MIKRPRGFAVLVLVAASTLSSCRIEAPFARDNPWDTGSNARLELTGPDSALAVGARIAVTLSATPALPPNGVIVWKSNEAGDGIIPAETQVWTAGPGLFEVRKATADFQRIAVSAKLDNNIVAWDVWVGQSVATLDLFCGTATVPVSCDATPMTINATRQLGTIATDANTNPIGRFETAMARGSITSRDPSVVSTTLTAPNAQGTVTARAVGAGTTWVVMRVDRAVDSVRFVVTP
jgi:hypothetical protein